MSLNRNDLIKQMSDASSLLLQEKGFISFVDILIQMGKLTKEDYEAWRFEKVPYLEAVIKINLGKINHLLVLGDFRKNSEGGGLRPSKTAYVSSGKKIKKPLRFTKSGESNLEEAYSTHFLKRKKGTSKPTLQSRENNHL